MVECPEFLLNFDALEKLASQYGLKLVYKKTFNEFFYEHHDNPEYTNLLGIMDALELYTDKVRTTKSPSEYEFIEKTLKEKRAEKTNDTSSSDNAASAVVEPNKTSDNGGTWASLSKSEWEAATLYLTFAFVKQSETSVKKNSDKG